MFKKNEKPLIEFVSRVKGLEEMQEIIPKPTKSFIPEWFKDTPNNLNSVKMCPSFPDYFSQGYVISAWADVILKYDKKSMRWDIKSSDLFHKWDIHTNNQFLDFAPATTPFPVKKDVSIIFKASSPWAVFTPKGYSIMQLPMLYNYDNEFSVVPGIIDTDIIHDLSIQMMFPADRDELYIKRGTPLATYIPFKRTKYTHVIRYENENDRKRLSSTKLYLASYFMGSGAYRKMQRKRDKEGE